MKKNRFSFFAFIVMLFAVLAAAGCVKKGHTDDVRLLYGNEAPKAVPSATAPRIVVVQFEDKRTSADLGVRKDGTPFKTSSSVPGWVTQALADELIARGAQVSVAFSMAQAQLNKPQYIVAGAVENVQLSEKTFTSRLASIRLQVQLHDSTQHLVSSTSSSQLEQPGIPGIKLGEEALSGALAKAAGNAADFIMGNLR
ncbi:MAG: hypothetical protein IJD65_05470 [Mailhella sp.]|nr:hypothetical protein [Mailhella sp.]